MRSNGNCWIVANYTWSGWRPRYRPPSGERSKITLVEDYNHRFRRLLGNAGAYALGRAQKNRVFTNGLLLGQALARQLRQETTMSLNMFCILGVLYG